MKNTAEKIKRSLTLCLYVIALSPLFYNTNYSLSQAATATWSLTSNGNSATTGNVTATAVSKGPGRPDYGGIGAMSHTADGVRSQNWNRSSYLSFSITSQYYNRDYYEYTVTPTPGNDFNVTSITLEASASTNSPSWFVYYSLDGFATYTQLGVRNSTSLTGLTITVPSGSTLTLRIFGMDLLASTTYFRNRNVVISGTTSLGCSAPTQPSTITGNGTICANANGTYSVTNDPVATSYTWTLPSGWTGSSSTNSISATSGANGGTITVTANNACGTSTQRTFNVTTAAAPAQPSSIAGSTSICVNANGTYSVTNDPAATSYTWALPSGWTGSSTTNSINATSGANGGTITVTANNACGNSSQQTVNVTTTGAPTQPSSIAGSTSICTNVNGTYSVTNDPAATSYTWTLPSGWTGSSTTNSINATSGANGGTITVTANNACGNSTQQTVNVTTTGAPTQPSSIAGSTSICVNANGTYSVTNDPAVTSYTWTLPSGWTGSSTTNSINATSGANGGTITVTANNACGNSTQQTVNVTTTGAPTQPSSITGSTSICANANGSYSVTNDPAATSYTWTLPSGWTGSSTTNSINATSGANGGTITVTANNACGTSSQQTFNVTTAAAPAQPSSIAGSTSICANANGMYSVTNDPTATSYTWTLPSGWTGSSTTNSINATSGANGGTITVTATNACGNSTQQTVNIITTGAPTQPSSITGSTSICANTNGTYSVTNDPTATSYTWTLPSGWSGSSITNSINATSGANGGTITVTANNTCGASAQQLLTVSTTVIDNTVSLSGSILTANQSGAVYQWINCTAGNVPVSGATSQSFTPASNGTYAVEIMHNGCSELSSCIAVSSVGVESVAMNSFDVYPNPGNGLYTISSKYALEPSQVKIYTASGQLINASAIVSQDKQLLIDISNQPEGIYIVSFSTPSSSFHLRISKQ